MDGAFKSNGAGAGVVIRDNVGEITATTAMRLHGIEDANHAEIMALWSGVILARELMFSNLITDDRFGVGTFYPWIAKGT